MLRLRILACDGEHYMHLIVRCQILGNFNFVQYLQFNF